VEPLAAVSLTGVGIGAGYGNRLPVVLKLGLVAEEVVLTGESNAGSIAVGLPAAAPTFVAAPPVRAPPLPIDGLAVAAAEVPVDAGGIRAGARWPVLALTMMSRNCSGNVSRPSVSKGS